MPTFDREKAAKEAADRVVRLIRHGGIASNSLSYGEEAIMIHELKDADEEVQARAAVITALDLVDQQRLHRYGLIDVPQKANIDWKELVLEEFRPEIEAALAPPAPDHEM